MLWAEIEGPLGPRINVSFRHAWYTTAAAAQHLFFCSLTRNQARHQDLRVSETAQQTSYGRFCIISDRCVDHIPPANEKKGQVFRLLVGE